MHWRESSTIDRQEPTSTATGETEKGKIIRIMFSNLLVPRFACPQILLKFTELAGKMGRDVSTLSSAAERIRDNKA
ncbi:hypothetical protein Geob_2090 [Geotalea daltonii FRC-32]|uniref:Uncharacterized protein n=1 Tax=Geotalea daltonii (strain DSM 22248 / JCM 15807 / FRC-32) TaxID=316067 RepID=B9M8U9_GEODF|nr:hypothetical protein Geob_2090 [Geotalea daltonii FRC-32]